MGFCGLATFGFIIWGFRNRAKVPVPLFKAAHNLSMLYLHFRGLQSDQLKHIAKSMENHVATGNGGKVSLSRANVINGYAVPSLEHQGLRNLFLTMNINGATVDSNIEKLRSKSKWIPFYIQAFDQMTIREHFVTHDTDKSYKDLKLVKVSATDGNVSFPSTICSKPKTIYFVHGGNYVMGRPDDYTGTMQKLARKCHVPVYCPDYRLLPEITPMQQQSDVLSGYLYLVNQLHYAPEDIVIVGDSAGAGLALKLMQDSIEIGIKPKAGVLISPVADLSLSGHSYRENLGNDELFSPQMVRFLKNSLEDSVMRQKERIELADAKISPLNGRFDGLPRLYVAASETELRYDDAKALVEKCRKAGTEVIFESAMYGVHNYPLMGDYVPEYAESFGRICDFIKIMHNNPVNEYPGSGVERDNIPVKDDLTKQK